MLEGCSKCFDHVCLIFVQVEQSSSPDRSSLNDSDPSGEADLKIFASPVVWKQCIHCFQQPHLLERSGIRSLGMQSCCFFTKENKRKNGHFFPDNQLPTDLLTAKWDEVETCASLLTWPSSSNTWWPWKLQRVGLQQGDLVPFWSFYRFWCFW